MATPAPSIPTTRHYTGGLIVGFVSISDHVSTGMYQSEGIPTLRDRLGVALSSPRQGVERLIPDDQAAIAETLIDLVDHAGYDLVPTTDGAGPTRHDVTPETTLVVTTKEVPGFSEQMHQISLYFVPTVILSRQVMVIHEVPSRAALIINLPGQSCATKEALEGLKDAESRATVPGIFAAVSYYIDLIGGLYIETYDSVVRAWRPKHVVRVKPLQV